MTHPFINVLRRVLAAEVNLTLEDIKILEQHLTPEQLLKHREAVTRNLAKEKVRLQNAHDAFLLALYDKKHTEDLPAGIKGMKDWDEKIAKGKDDFQRGNAIMQSLRATLGKPAMRFGYKSAILVIDMKAPDVKEKLDAGGYVPYIKMFPANKRMHEYLIRPEKGIVILVHPTQIISGKYVTKIDHISFQDALDYGDEAHKLLNAKRIPDLKKEQLQKMLKKDLGNKRITKAWLGGDDPSDLEGTLTVGNDEVAYANYRADYEETIDGTGVPVLGWMEIFVCRDPLRPGKLMASISNIEAIG